METCEQLKPSHAYYNQTMKTINWILLPFKVIFLIIYIIGLFLWFIITRKEMNNI
jgi:hypothetical protein